MPGRRQQGEGSLYQRGRQGGRPGQWVAIADLGHKAGKRDRREFTGPTPQAAMGKRERFLDRRRDGFTVPRGRQPYVSEWMLHWLHNIARRKVEATTWEKSYRQKVTSLICPYFDRVPLPELDEEAIEEWHAQLEATVSERTGRPLSASTITQAHRILSAGLKVAVVRGRMARNPASNVSPPSGEASVGEPPGDDEVFAILRECEDRRTGPRWVTGIATGLRQGETLGVLWPYLELDDVQDASLAVEWELVRLPWRHGCEDPQACGQKYHVRACPPRDCPRIRLSGRPHACIRPGDPRCCEPGCEEHARRCPRRHGGGLRLKRPKSDKSRARIPVAPYAAAALRQWKKDQKAERLAHPAWKGWVHDCARQLRPGEHVCPDCMLPARPDLLVFTRPDGLPVDSRADWEDWTALLKSAGLPHYRVHDGRHGVATTLLEDGVDIRVVQEMMRHATPDFTRRAYQHVRVKLKREAADVMDRRMRGGR